MNGTSERYQHRDSKVASSVPCEVPPSISQRMQVPVMRRAYVRLTSSVKDGTPYPSVDLYNPEGQQPSPQ